MVHEEIIHDQAVDHLKEALDIAQKIGDLKLEIKTLFDLYKIYFYYEMWCAAERCLERIVELQRRTEELPAELYYDVAVALLNSAIVHWDSNYREQAKSMWSDALAATTKALKLLRERGTGADANIAHVLIPHGQALEALGRRQEAFEAYQMAEAGLEKSRQHPGQERHRRELQTALSLVHQRAVRNTVSLSLFRESPDRADLLLEAFRHSGLY